MHPDNDTNTSVDTDAKHSFYLIFRHTDIFAMILINLSFYSLSFFLPFFHSTRVVVEEEEE